MKRLAVIAVATLLASGCSTWSNLSGADKGTVIGAGAGAAVGNAAGGGVLGTVGGAAVGGVIGRQIGKDRD